MDQAKDQIRNLIEYLNDRTKEYDMGIPTISDKEWDEKYFELDCLEKKYSIYFNDSPTQNISYEVVNSLEKVEHNHEMLSLEKTKSLNEIKDFLGIVPYLAMCKMDGLTCSLKYYDGVLVSAETRGNGLIGENILHNARVIPSIPKYIPYKGLLVVDGEIICSKHDFKEFENEYKNPRNFASGSIRLLDSKECSKRKLQFVAWDVIQGFEDSKYLVDKLFSLMECGFTIVPYCAYDNYDRDIDELKNMAEIFGYPIDGVVFKFDDVEYGRSLGKTAHHFKNAMAYKFYDEEYETELLDIEWSIGRTGILTPIAVFKTVEIDGTEISRASLHNISIMREVLFIPYVGQKLWISKRNMIIPQVEKADRDFDNSKNMIAVTSICPICGSETAISSDGNSDFLICKNPTCEGKLINKLDHFVGKKGLDIKGLSKATLEKLINWNWISNFIDIFNLKNYRSEWIKKPGFGEKSVDNILDAIEKSKECELGAFICSLGIPLIGSTASKELVKVFPSWEQFIGAIESNYHFWEIPNFGGEMHQSITKFDYTEAKELYNYLTISNVINEDSNNNLEGLNFVITGKLIHFKNRDELKALIERRGGKVVGSISSKTNYLINNDINSTSSKNQSAKKLNIPIISEENFIEVFGGID